MLQPKTPKVRPRRCILVVENLPVPLDRRVWQEARALRSAGWNVTVICPTSSQYPKKEETLEGITILRFSLPIEGRRATELIWEYGFALWHIFKLLLKCSLRGSVDVVQVCNPPDLLWLPALPFKLRGAKLVFDHHDLCPELYDAKFRRGGLIRLLLCAAERTSIKLADSIISANASYREIAITRCHKSPSAVTTVYSVPDMSRFKVASKTNGRGVDDAVVLGYVGIINDQDGVDNFVRMLAHECLSSPKILGLVVGDGPALGSVKELATSLGIRDRIEFTGYLTGDPFFQALARFDIGIIPDPPNPYNDKISMNKVFEYCALGIPSAAFNLSETRRLLGDAGVYADHDSADGLAQACSRLLTDPRLHNHCCREARHRATSIFNWENEAAKYVAVFERLVQEAEGASINTTAETRTLSERTGSLK